MKKVLAAVLSLAMAFSLAACGGQSVEQSGGEDGEPREQTDDVQTPNPFTTYESREEAEQAAGYSFAVPESLDGFDTITYSVMIESGLLEVVYQNDDDELIARKAPGDGDISGDYNQYEEVTIVDKDGLPGVTFSSAGGKAYLAVWSDPEIKYTYSLMDRNGMDPDTFAALVNTIQEGEAQSNPGGDAPMVGGWTVNGGDLSINANPDAVTALEKALDGLLGYSYEPLALLGTQVVAGTNYRILCRDTAVAPDAVPSYEIVTVYADLEGNAEIIDTTTLTDTPENNGPVTGGWTVNSGDFTLNGNPEVEAAFEKALEGLVGAEYEAVAYMAGQVVAGMNYQLFCRVTPVVPDAVPHFSVVTVYADLEGNAELTDVSDVTF